MGTGSFPGVNRPGHGFDHPPPSSAEVKDRVELYLYSPIWLHGADRNNFTLLIIIIIIIIIIINCNWVVTRWQWLFYMYTEYKIVYY